MLRLIGIMISIGLADSLNPSTLAPALVMATGERGRHDVSRFALGVFLVYFLGGALIALGPGELVLDLVPRPSPHTGQILEVIAGVVLLAAAALLWRHRIALGKKQLLSDAPSNRSAFLLGATIMLVELPTAFPYFGAIAAIVGSDQPIYHQVLLLLLYNVCFCLPMAGIYWTLSFYGDRAEEHLARARGFLQRHWPAALAVVALIAGGLTIGLGLTGLFARGHGPIGNVAKKLHKLLPGS